VNNGCGFMKMTKLVPNMLEKSRFNHRLHRLGELVFLFFFSWVTSLKVWQEHLNMWLTLFLYQCVTIYALADTRCSNASNKEVSSAVCGSIFTG